MARALFSNELHSSRVCTTSVQDPPRLVKKCAPPCKVAQSKPRPNGESRQRPRQVHPFQEASARHEGADSGGGDGTVSLTSSKDWPEQCARLHNGNRSSSVRSFGFRKQTPSDRRWSCWRPLQDFLMRTHSSAMGFCPATPKCAAPLPAEVLSLCIAAFAPLPSGL